MGEISIKITIADRVFPLSISSEEEEIVRKAAKIINERIHFMKGNYAFKDQQDLLSMVVLEFASKLTQMEYSAHNDDELIVQKVDQIHQTLQKVFEK